MAAPLGPGLGSGNRIGAGRLEVDGLPWCAPMHATDPAQVRKLVGDELPIVRPADERVFNVPILFCGRSSIAGTSWPSTPGSIVRVQRIDLDTRSSDFGPGEIRERPGGVNAISHWFGGAHEIDQVLHDVRSEEHTSELQSRLHLVCR